MSTIVISGKLQHSINYQKTSDDLHRHLLEKSRKEFIESRKPTKPFINESKKIGRNNPCSCGSGKKFKKCHGG